MKRSLQFSVIALLLLITSAAGAGRSQAHAGEVSLVWWLDNPAQVSGAAEPEAYSTLQRGYFSVNLGMHTSGLTPGHTYSLWWVIFQNPKACVGGCGDDEMNNAAATGVNPAGVSVHYGGALTAAESGVAEFGARLLEDSVEDCPTAGPYKSLCSPMTDAAVADVLVFLMDHGPAGAAPVRKFDTGCARMVWFGYTVADYHQAGFDCYRAQSTFHQP